MAIKDPFSGGNVGQNLATRGWGGEKKIRFFFSLKLKLYYSETKKKKFLTQPPYEAPPPDLVKILTKN